MTHISEKAQSATDVELGLSQKQPTQETGNLAGRAATIIPTAHDENDTKKKAGACSISIYTIALIAGICMWAACPSDSGCQKTGIAFTSICIIIASCGCLAGTAMCIAACVAKMRGSS